MARDDTAAELTLRARHRAPRPDRLVWSSVLVLLPPSESKRAGGDGPPQDLGTLSAPILTPVRARLADALVRLADDVPAARAAPGLSPAQDDEVARNAALCTSPTLPALERYTGVLYDALGVANLSRAQRRRAEARLAVGSALFGLVRAADRVPAYRLSAGSALPSQPTLRTLWRPALGPVLAGVDDLLVDLRSGSYQALAPVPGAVTVEVVSERRRLTGRGQPRQQGAQGPGRPAAGDDHRRAGRRRQGTGAAAPGRVARGTRRRDGAHPRRPRLSVGPGRQAAP